MVTTVTDREQLRTWLMRDPALHLYELGDLDDADGRHPSSLASDRIAQAGDWYDGTGDARHVFARAQLEG